MKKIYTTLVLLFTIAFANAQVVSIPDMNFKLYLLSASPTNQKAKDISGNWTMIDINGDNLIQQSEANNISELYIFQMQNYPIPVITNYTGINSFNSLIKLRVIGNVSSFVFTNKTSIKEIYFGPAATFSVIDVSNNPNLEVLNFQSNYFDTTGPGLHINSIDLSGCIGLKKFNFPEHCTLTSFDGTGLINLEELTLTGIRSGIFYNDTPTFLSSYSNEHGYLESINISDCVNLKKIDVRGSNLSSLDLSNKINLIDVKVSYQFHLEFNPATNYTELYFQPFSLNTNGCSSLEYIDARGVNFTSNSTFNNLPSLEELRINAFLTTNPTNLDVSNCPNLKILDCEGNFKNYDQITTPSYYCVSNIQGINLANSNNIEYLNCKKNKIVNLDLSNKPQLTTLICEDNLLNNINLDNCNSLTTVTVQDNQLTNLDLSSCGVLQSVNCDNNQLTYLCTKNNTNETKTFLNNPNLTYICADETEQNSVQLIVNLYEMWDTCNVGDYCSFNPNGNYNTLSGNALYDNENDGCDITDEAFEFLRLNLNDGTNSGSTFTNFEGNYKFFANAGNFTLTPQLENPTYFAVSPTSVPVFFADNLNNTASNNFCITPNGVHNDVEVVLAQVTPARPGFDAEYSLVFKNKGNQMLSGAVSVTFEDDTLDFVNASVAPTSNTTGLLSWNYNNLLPFENRSITFTLNVNAPTETPAVNNGDVLAFNATITPLAGDEIPADNSYAYNQTVVGSYDPNDIYCLEGDVVDPALIGQYLHYNVRFENTGTAAAENIVVATTINPNDYDLNTLQVLNTSHNVYTRMTGNFVEFVFENIQLAGSPSSGHGNILFKMKSKSNLQTNDEVSSNANIFFDYNFPVATNDAATTFEVLNNQEFTKDNSISIYPNPTSSMVTINSDSTIKSIELYDVQGRLLQTKIQNQTEVVFDISDKSNGIYFLKITSDKGSKVKKVVKK